MKRSTVVAGLFVLVGAVPGTLDAQQPQQAQAQAQAGRFIVARAFQCNPQSGGVAWLQAWRPVVQQMVTEGKFIGYGILTHAWGDDWNVNDYFVVADISAFMQDFNELVRRLGQSNVAAPTYENEQGQSVPRRPFGEICTRHKDNIYAIVQPPAGT